MIDRIVNQNIRYRIFQRLFLRGPATGIIVAVVNKARRFQARRATGPSSLILFVTNRCQMACPFCFYRNSLNHGETALSLDEITRLAGSLKTVRRLNLTGGEPFLREDLVEIVRIFRKACKVTYLNIPTNGMRTDVIADQILGILDTTTLPHVKVQISVDALGADHDQLRKTGGAFDKAVDTLTTLRKICNEYPRLSVEIAANVTTLLMANIKEFVSFFSTFNVPVKFSIIRDGAIVFPRGLPKVAANPYHTEVNSELYPTLESLKTFYSTLESLNQNSPYQFWCKIQQIKFKQSLRILERGQRLFPCYAGMVEAVIYHTGDVSLCEYTPPVGNLREYDFDFSRLWHSADADRGRRKIQSCSCIHGCHLLTSLSYDDKTLTSLFSFRG